MRTGFLSDGNESDGESDVEVTSKTSAAPRKSGIVISSHHMRRPAVDAIRDAVFNQAKKLGFAIIYITKETLSGRTSGAEQPDLAERIMGGKIDDIEELEGEEKVILVDERGGIEGMFDEIRKRIGGCSGFCERKGWGVIKVF